MSLLVDGHVDALDAMKSYPKTLFYEGELSLLRRRKISIVGSRRASEYSKNLTYQLAKKLSDIGITIVSGAAMGIDAVAHQAAGRNTIAVMANGLDIVYPKINAPLIKEIKTSALALSSYSDTTKATKYSFVERNEIVVALGEVLIVSEADLNSGSMRSVEYALRMQKKIYVLPHRIHESSGTNYLLAHNQAELIDDIDAFVSRFKSQSDRVIDEDDLINFCKLDDSYESVVAKFGHKVFEYELEGKIAVKNSRVIVL